MTSANVKPASEGAQSSVDDAITLDKLCKDLKVNPRDARMLLRLAAKQSDKYPNLGKDHVARQPWQWAPGSKGLEEARKVLLSAPDAKTV